MIPQLGVDSLAADTQMPHFLFSWPCFHHQQPRKAFGPGPSLRLSHPVLHHCSKNGFYSKLLTVTHQQPLYTQKFCSIPEEKTIKTNNFLSCFDCKGPSNFQITSFFIRPVSPASVQHSVTRRRFAAGLSTQNAHWFSNLIFFFCPSLGISRSTEWLHEEFAASLPLSPPGPPKSDTPETSHEKS